MVRGQWVPNARLAAQLELAYFHRQAGLPPLKRTAQMQIRLGEKSGKLLKKMTGQFTVEANTLTQSLIVVDNIRKAIGKTTKGPRGGSITILDVAKDKNGNHEIRFKLESPPNCGGGAATTSMEQLRLLELRPGHHGAANLALVDARGAAFPLVGSAVTKTNGDVVQSLTFQAQQGREPARLVFSAQRRVNVDVPFSFREVKLP
jgi:hypothetical protein